MTSELVDDFTFRDDSDPFIFEVWRRHDHIAGTQRQDFKTEQVSRYPMVLRFQSTFGWFIIVSNETDITRQECIHFAKAFAFGNVIHYRIDLKGIGR